MSIYIIGDIHGYVTALERLLLKINFNSCDFLWFTGDLINGGEQSVETIRLVKSFNQQAICVLGNHDFMLLACSGNKKLLELKTSSSAKHNNRINGFTSVLNAPDKLELLNWLEHRPLAYYNQQINILLVHAGVHPNWNIPKTLELANEVAAILRSPDAISLYQEYSKLYDNQQAHQSNNWDDQLIGLNRICCIINYLTRMRFCTIIGELDLYSKGSLEHGAISLEYVPWFEIEQRKTRDTTIAFGHWAALNGAADTKKYNVIALDTGCGWGKKLTAYRVEDQQFFDVDVL